jgi:ubiquinone/menaquinone biosynthesis C-methylase UbiE
MNVREEFDDWAREGRDRGMEDRHWHTAKHALAWLPVEPDDVALDLGTGSGYAARTLREVYGAARAYGLDGAPGMVRSARSYTDDSDVGYVVGDFEHLPLDADAVDHCFSMEAFYYAGNPHAALRELRRVLSPGGTFTCAVDYFEESVHTRRWADWVDVPMTRWSETQYRTAFHEAGFHVAAQSRVPDREVDIPPAAAFPTEDFDTREAMVERYREHGTLVTIGVAPA